MSKFIIVREKTGKLLTKKTDGKDNAVVNQLEHIKNVRNNKFEDSYGISKYFRLLLVYSPFLFPNMCIRFLAGFKSYLARKKAIEIYVVFKVLFPLIVMSFGLSGNKLALFFVIYFLVETILYLLSLVFLSDTYEPPHSAKRSVLLVLLNYVEVTFDFAVIYKGFKLIVKPIDYFILSESTISSVSMNSSTIQVVGTTTSKSIISSIEALYFSFITSTTVGYGDYLPTKIWGNVVVIMQVITMLIFLILFVNYFTSILLDDRKKSKKAYQSHPDELKTFIEKSKSWDDNQRLMLLGYMKYLESLDETN